jgi:hypothetical protein
MIFGLFIFAKIVLDYSVSAITLPQARMDSKLKIAPRQACPRGRRLANFTA